MRLNEYYFEKMKAGQKTIEIRLCDQKRKDINIEDIIVFSKQPDCHMQLSVKVVGLLSYSSFEDILNDFSMDYFGCPKDYNKMNFIEQMHKIYTKEEEQKYGVLGIKVEVI